LLKLQQKNRIQQIVSKNIAEKIDSANCQQKYFAFSKLSAIIFLKNRIQQIISENIAETIHSANCQQKYRQNLGLGVPKIRCLLVRKPFFLQSSMMLLLQTPS